MHCIHSVSGDLWTIVNERDELVFQGTKQRCEDWLDDKDNARPRPSAVTAWIRWLIAAWLAPRQVRVSSILCLPASREPMIHLPVRRRQCTQPRRVCTIDNKSL